MIPVVSRATEHYVGCQEFVGVRGLLPGLLFGQTKILTGLIIALAFQYNLHELVRDTSGAFIFAGGELCSLCDFTRVGKKAETDRKRHIVTHRCVVYAGRSVHVHWSHHRPRQKGVEAHDGAKFGDCELATTTEDVIHRLRFPLSLWRLHFCTGPSYVSFDILY